MNWFKKRNNQIIAGIVVILLLVGGYFVISARSRSNKPATVEDSTVQKISAEEIGLSVEASPDKKKVKFKIDKPQGIKSIEYSIVYEADSTTQEQSEGGEARVQRGITGDAKFETDSKPYESDWLDLGSCSKNVCRYDTGVKSVDLTLKIVKSDGKTYQTEKNSDL